MLLCSLRGGFCSSFCARLRSSGISSLHATSSMCLYAEYNQKSAIIYQGSRVSMLDRVSELYYTAREARAVLGLNEHTFQTWVKSGKIARTKLPGMGQGVYLKREIDKKARLIEAAMFLDTTKDLEYKPATALEVDAETHLAHLI